MITWVGDCTTCIGNGISRMRGTPGGKQRWMGSCESGVARGPYPGLAFLNLASAQACIGGSLAENVTISWWACQTPDRSGVAEGAECLADPVVALWGFPF